MLCIHSFVVSVSVVNLRHWVNLAPLCGSVYITALNPCAVLCWYDDYSCSIICSVLRSRCHCLHCNPPHVLWCCKTNKTIIKNLKQYTLRGWVHSLHPTVPFHHGFDIHFWPAQPDLAAVVWCHSTMSCSSPDDMRRMPGQLSWWRVVETSNEQRTKEGPQQGCGCVELFIHGTEEMCTLQLLGQRCGLLRSLTRSHGHLSLYQSVCLSSSYVSSLCKPAEWIEVLFVVATIGNQENIRKHLNFLHRFDAAFAKLLWLLSVTLILLKHWSWQNSKVWITTYNGLGTEDVTLVLTGAWNPDNVGKVVKESAVLTCTEDAVNVMHSQLLLQQKNIRILLLCSEPRSSAPHFYVTDLAVTCYTAKRYNRRRHWLSFVHS